MKKLFLPRSFGRSVPATLILYFLGSVSAWAQALKPNEVKFCDLIRDGKYDGKLVKTTALYSRKIDGDSLTSNDCPSTLNEQHTANAIIGHDFNQSSRNAKALSKLLKRGATAEVTVTGVVHAQPGQEHGYYQVPLQIEIKEVDEVKVPYTPR